MEESAKPQRTVLIVEDDPLSARVAEKILGRLGYGILGMARTGEEALDAARQAAPDVVLMDINLAGAMDGMEAAGALIAEFGVPVIFLTAAVDRDIMERVAGAGAAGGSGVLTMSSSVRMPRYSSSKSVMSARDTGTSISPISGSLVGSAATTSWDRAMRRSWSFSILTVG